MYEEILNEMLTEAITHARNVDSEIYGEQNEDFWKALKG